VEHYFFRYATPQKRQKMEKQIENYLRLEIKKIGGLALKFTSPNFSGVPDRIILYKGKTFFVEVKDEGKKLRPRQEFVKRQFEALGFQVLIIDSKEKIKKLINDLQT
jgi:hypothetical protein